MKFVRQFKGHSTSSVFLVDIAGKHYVYKTMLKNAELCASVSNNLPFYTPEIFDINKDSILMEYIPGIDMKQYLTYGTKAEIEALVYFLSDYIEYSLSYSELYNFEKEIAEKYNTIKPLVNIDYHIDLMPKVFPKGPIHGDLTLENILFYNNKFYFVDINYTELNSIYFDINKLRQDINGYWFIREERYKMNYVSSCNFIYTFLNRRFKDMFNNHIYAFMLSRILPYCKRDFEFQFVLSEIEKCKS